MSLAPTPPSAINTRATFSTSVDRMSALSERIATTQEAISTGRRVNRPSDDPVASARASTLRRDLAKAATTNRNIDAANHRLRAAEITLAAIGELSLRARELALAGNNAALSADDRAVMAQEVRSLVASLQGLAEARDVDGVPLFSGSRTTGPTYAPDIGGTLVWQGAGQPPAIALAATSIETGLTGPQAFGVTSAPTLARPDGTADLFASMAALAEALENPDAEPRAAALETALAELETHGERLTDAQAILGTRAARLTSEQERLAAQSLASNIDLSRLEDTDMASSIAQLQRLLNVLEAAQASFARTANQSLWDLLR